MAGGIDRRADKDVAKAHSLFFEAIQQSARPDELGGKNTKAKENRKPAGARRDDHDDTQRKQSEAEDNLYPSLRLLNCLDQHQLITPSAPDFQFSGGACYFDAAIRQKFREHVKFHFGRSLREGERVRNNGLF